MASTEEDMTARDSTNSYTEPSVTFSTTLDTSNSKLDITRSYHSTLLSDHSSLPLYFLRCREELEKRQLLHRIELLKLELSQKALVVDTLRNEQASQVQK